MQTGKARFLWQNSDDPDDVMLCSVEEYALAYYRYSKYLVFAHKITIL